MEKMKISVKGVLMPWATRGYAGIIGNVFKTTRAKYETNLKQKHFRCVQFTFDILVCFIFGGSRCYFSNYLLNLVILKFNNK